MADLDQLADLYRQRLIESRPIEDRLAALREQGDRAAYEACREELHAHSDETRRLTADLPTETIQAIYREIRGPVERGLFRQPKRYPRPRFSVRYANATRGWQG